VFAEWSASAAVDAKLEEAACDVVPSIGFMLPVECFVRADVQAMVRR